MWHNMFLVLFSQGRGFYIVTNGLSAYHTWAHIHCILSEENFKVGLTDLSEKIGVLSVQGPKRCVCVCVRACARVCVRVRTTLLFLDVALLIQITNNVALGLQSCGIWHHTVLEQYSDCAVGWTVWGLTAGRQWQGITCLRKHPHCLWDPPSFLFSRYWLFFPDS
jgi:hypothetical protein